MSAPIVELEDVRRQFRNVEAVRGISFQIMPGQVVGFIGANGAGKTTTMRMMVTLDLPTSGRIRIAGFDVLDYPHEVRRRVGWMPDAFGFYENMTVYEYMDFYARAFGFRGEERRRRVDEVMEFTDLSALAERRMNKLSKGMGQRLCLGRTLLHDPALLVLDEPAAGLDPKARIEFKHLVRLLAGEGKTIFISSHILSELGEMCDTLLFIDNGVIVHHGTAQSLQRGDDAAAIVEVRVLGEPVALHDWAKLQPDVSLIESTMAGAKLQIHGVDGAAVADVLRRMVAHGIPVTEFRREERRLEDAFVEMLKKVEGAPE
jgi:ABC-2 type transport system ATP-binding protein